MNSDPIGVVIRWLNERTERRWVSIVFWTTSALGALRLLTEAIVVWVGA